MYYVHPLTWAHTLLIMPLIREIPKKLDHSP